MEVFGISEKTYDVERTSRAKANFNETMNSWRIYKRRRSSLVDEKFFETNRLKMKSTSSWRDETLVMSLRIPKRQKMRIPLSLVTRFACELT